MFAFDGLIRRQLQKLIGQAGDANVQVHNGNVCIEDVHFDEAALEELAFPPVDDLVPPVGLSTVHVRRLAISIPWGNLKKGFIDVELDGLSVCLSRRTAHEVTAEMLRARKEACVAALMAGLVEQVTSSTKASKKPKKKQDGSKEAEEDDSKGAGLLGAKLEKMLRGVVRKALESFRPVIRLTNVHIRYEDLGADASSPLALGVTIGRLFVQHPDSPYSEIDEDPNMMPVKDVVSLEVAQNGVGVYMHTKAMGATTVIGGGPTPALPTTGATADKAPSAKQSAAAARRAAASNGGEDDRTVEAMKILFDRLMMGETPHGPLQWLVEPIAVSGKVHVNVGIFINAPTRFQFPMIVADLQVSPLRISVSHLQASSLVAASAELMAMPARYLYQMIRPSWSSNLPVRSLWRAAIQAVLHGLVTLSGATRMRNTVRDRMRYQSVITDAIATMRARGDAQVGTQLEDVMHVTTADKRRIQLEPGQPGGAGSPGADQSTSGLDKEHGHEPIVDALMEMDALTPPLQIALWRLMAWTDAKTAADQQKLEGRKGRRALLSSATSGKDSAMSADEVMEASSAMTVSEDEGNGDDPLALAPASFEMVVANVRVDGISVALMIDDSNRGAWDAEETARAAVTAAAVAESKMVTTETTTKNLDGSTTTTTSVTKFTPPRMNMPTSKALSLHLNPIVSRIRLAPKAGTTLHLVVGDINIEHQCGRGSEEVQNLLCFTGTSKIDDASELLGPSMPATEVPRPSFMGFLSAALPMKQGRSDAVADGPTAVTAHPALHAVISLPADARPDVPPGAGSTQVKVNLQRGEARVAPHQLHGIWHAFFTPLDTAMDLIPGATLTREMVFILRETAEGLLIKPWWAALNALPAAFEGIGGAIPDLRTLDVEATIVEGITVHLLAEPPVGTSLNASETIPHASVHLPPMKVALAPDETDKEHQVRVSLQLKDDMVLSAPKEKQSMRPLSGPGAAPVMDPSQLMVSLISEQMQLIDELKDMRAANQKLTDELNALRLERSIATSMVSIPALANWQAPSAAAAPIHAGGGLELVQQLGPIDTIGSRAVVSTPSASVPVQNSQQAWEVTESPPTATRFGRMRDCRGKGRSRHTGSSAVSTPSATQSRELSPRSGSESSRKAHSSGWLSSRLLGSARKTTSAAHTDTSDISQQV